MDADFSIELGNDDPVLDFPWTDPEGKFDYFDLKRHPELLLRVQEAKQFPELGKFLQMVNSAISGVESAKCDAWESDELLPEEEIFAASQKVVSYTDLVFSAGEQRFSLPSHERFVERLTELLRQAPEIPSSAEAFVRRAYYPHGRDVREGFYITLYTTGYADDSSKARENWGIALQLVGNAVLQLSAEPQT